MKNVFWLIVGIAVGFVVAHEVSKTPGGKRFFDDVNGKSHDFASAIVDGYKQREAELRSAVSDIEDAATKAAKKIK